MSEEKIQELKQSAEEKNFIKLKRYLDRLENFYVQCTQAYDELEKDCDCFKYKCSNTMKMCKEKKEVARKRKITTKVVGGAATAGAIVVAGGGTAVSIALGVCSFGILTPVSLGMTALASGALATTSGVVTHSTAEDYEDTEKKFESLSQKFSDLQSNMSEMRNKMQDAHEGLTRVQEKVEKVKEETEDEEYEYDVFCCFLDMLTTEIKEKGPSLLKSIACYRNPKS